MILSSPGQVTQAQSTSCHLRELDLCATSLLVLGQSPGGLATNEQEINKQCVHLRDADTCLRNYTRRCMTPLHRELVSLATNSSMGMLNEYCTRGSQLRSNYLKHSKCLNEVYRKDQRACTRNLQAALELLTGSAELAGKRAQLGCCTYRAFEQCLSTAIEKRCGKETLLFSGDIARRLGSRLPEALCRQYRPDSHECRALLPSANATPMRAKSSSIISRLLSTYSGLK